MATRPVTTMTDSGRMVRMQLDDVTYTITGSESGYVTISARSTADPGGRALLVLDKLDDQARPGTILLRARNPHID